MADDDLKTDDVKADDDILANIESSVKASGEGDEQTSETDKTADDKPKGEPTGEVDKTKPADEPARGPQDLIDAQGNIVARGGPDRRHFETSQKQKVEIDRLNAKIGTLEGASTVGTQLGVTPEEAIAGVRIMAAFKNDPSATINYLLTQAKSSGHNVDSVGGANVDSSAIARMIDQKLAPLLNNIETQNQQTAATQQATEQYNDFIGAYPDAKTHENTLAQLIKADQSLTPVAAYFKLKNFYLERSLDWTKPLDVLQKELVPGEKGKPNTQGVLQPSLPNGATPPIATDTSEVADASTSMDDIVDQSMREHGLIRNQ